MFKLIGNVRKVMNFIKKYKADIERFKDSVVVMTPIFEDFKKLVGELEL